MSALPARRQGLGGSLRKTAQTNEIAQARHNNNELSMAIVRSAANAVPWFVLAARASTGDAASNAAYGPHCSA